MSNSVNSQLPIASSTSPVISTPFGVRERQQDLENLTNTVYDICVVGGGITGAAIARDAALRGLKTLLLEKNDFASGTSSRSSKLVHGGVRYLEQYEFKLVFEATRERARLWKLAPHLVTPMPFVFPTFTYSRVPLWKLGLGLWLYDILSLFQSPTMHKKWNRAKTLLEEPLLKEKDLVGSIFYWDGATDDALLTLCNILDARALGATTLSRSEVLSVQWNSKVSADPEEFHIIEVSDRAYSAQPKTYRAKARVVISAAGPWTDNFLIRAKQKSRTLLAPTRGSHIVVPYEKLKAKHAVVIFHPKDGRVLFTIPWGQFTVVGTTDVYDKDNPEHVHITSSETEYLIDAANNYFPEAKLSKHDIVSTWSGLRPLLAPPDKASASQVSREHHIEWFEPGLLVIAGGKLTTHREMAEQAVDKVLEHCMGWERMLSSGYQRCQTYDRYIPRPLYPEYSGAPIGTSEGGKLSLADIAGICRTQMVMSLEDLLVRRTLLFYKEPHNAWLLLPRIKDTVCKELGWSEDQWKSEVEAYKSYLQKNVLEPLGRTLPTTGPASEPTTVPT